MGNKPSYEEFLSSVKKHTLTISLDNGLHRHITCSEPNSFNRRFHVVTWPGYLSYTGDMGSYVFTRLDDMFSFFRSDDAVSINPGYWAEKLRATDVDDGHLEFSQDKLRTICLDTLELSKDDISVLDITYLVKRLEEYVLVADNEYEARDRLSSLTHNGSEVFSDTWEWNLRDYTYHYIWACYAIVHAIGMYDKAREQQP